MTNPATWGKGRGRVDRRDIPDGVLALVDERQGGRRCAFCSSEDGLELDHIVPVSQGGDSHWRNLQWLCRPCNRRKRCAPGRGGRRASLRERARRGDFD